MKFDGKFLNAVVGKSIETTTSSVTSLAVGTAPPHQLLGSFQSLSVEPMNLPAGAHGGTVEAIQSDEVPKKSKSNIAVIPYTIASTSKDVAAGTPSDNNFDVGLDAKIALTSSLNLDVTVNPDFSQVDVDRQVTNLTTVNIRFPEQRIFFVENSDIFSGFGTGSARPFFSRRIGLDEDNNQVVKV